MRTIDRRVSGLSGYAPALPTPFTEDGAVDFGAFERFCDFQISEGATALVVCGTTGEAPTLTPNEQRDLIRRAVQIAGGRVPVIAGAGSNCTARAVDLTRAAEAVGADAILSVVPYYNKPTQAGLYAHFRTIAAATGLPLFLYDVPSRTACGLADETIARLAELPHIVGLKDATGDVARLERLKSLVGLQFRLLSGDDATALAFILQGGHGCISVTSNVIPSLCLMLHLACRDNRIVAAQRLAAPINALTQALFRETNPTPLKYALSLLGWMRPTLRLPLVEPSDNAKAEIAAILSKLAADHSDHVIGKMPSTNHPVRALTIA